MLLAHEPTHTAPTPRRLPLSQLRPGQVGTIHHIHSQPAARRRLLEMGLVRGERITVERYAPLGDPIEFTVKVGDKVLISKYGGTEVKVDGQEVLIINESDILGIVS